jgi:hypothetical protein
MRSLGEGAHWNCNPFHFGWMNKEAQTSLFRIPQGFEQEGGFTEHLYRVRSQNRNRQPTKPR